MNMLPTILLLREGTDNSSGRGQILANINAVEAIAEILKTTLGPRGMDKMITTAKDTTITNDGATVLELLDIEHPAAKILVDIAKSQDQEVGDGTTTVTLLAGEMLRESKYFVDEGLSPQVIIRGYRKALEFALEQLKDLAIGLATKDRLEERNMMLKCAGTALNSKLLAAYKDHFSELVVRAVEKLDTTLLDKELIGIKQVTGGSISESFLVEGVAFKKTFSYAGFEQQPKSFVNPKIILLKIELELKAERDNAEVRIEKVEDFQKIVDAEWTIIYEKMEKMKALGANIVLSQLPIGDLSTQWFADRGIFCAGRVDKDDMNRLAKATGASILTTVNSVKEEALGTCGLFQERQLGAERFNIFEKCNHGKAATIVIRGGAEQFIKEAERSLNDAIMIVRRCFKASKIVPGGGAFEMQLSKKVRAFGHSVSGKEQFAINAFAKALEVIPRTIADNAGLDSLAVMNKLRNKHATDKENGKYFGVDISGEGNGVCNTYVSFVWEPMLVKYNALSAATEAACTILSIDETIRNPRSEQQVQEKRIQKASKGAPRLGGLQKNARMK